MELQRLLGCPPRRGHDAVRKVAALNKGAALSPNTSACHRPRQAGEKTALDGRERLAPKKLNCRWKPGGAATRGGGGGAVSPTLRSLLRPVVPASELPGLLGGPPPPPPPPGGGGCPPALLCARLLRRAPPGTVLGVGAKVCDRGHAAPLCTRSSPRHRSDCSPAVRGARDLPQHPSGEDALELAPVKKR